MTVDVEDYFQVSAFEKQISREKWDQLPPRVEKNTERILELLGNHGVKATFFVLGWVAERHPILIRGIAGEGHEVASHGYGHVRATEQQPEQFREDVIRAKKLLEDIVGEKVIGYRAPSFSIDARNLWVFDVLQDTGYRYSSSIFPIRHDLYGMPEAPRFAFYPREDGLLEVPLTTLRVGNLNVPCGGGGYFRLFPYGFSRWALRRVNHRDKQPAVFFFHPWELDPDQPRQRGVSLKTRFRHYFNLRRMEARIVRLLMDFQWGRIDEVFLERSAISNELAPRAWSGLSHRFVTL